VALGWCELCSIATTTSLFLKNFGNGGLGKEIWREALGEGEAVQRIRGGQVVGLGSSYVFFFMVFGLCWLK
jgi:hypothetical protein